VNLLRCWFFCLRVCGRGGGSPFAGVCIDVLCLYVQYTCYICSGVAQHDTSSAQLRFGVIGFSRFQPPTHLGRLLAVSRSTNISPMMRSEFAIGWRRLSFFVVVSHRILRSSDDGDKPWKRHGSHWYTYCVIPPSISYMFAVSIGDGGGLYNT
jgi:hypothetical protein